VIGISAFGVYVPAYRLAREVIAQATGGRAGSGGRAVAQYDEDALTMGVDASLECLDNYARSFGSAVPGEKLKALLFASASSPFREKQAASLLAAVLEAGRSALVTDVSGSLRGGLTALGMAASALTGRPAGDTALVVASDRRMATPASGEEAAFGDGAAALLMGQENVLATLEAHFAVQANFPHFWRRENDPFVQVGDGRFSDDYGYMPLMNEALQGLLKKAGLAAADVTKVILYAPNARLATRLARKAGFNADTQLADGLLKNIGDTGNAQVFLSLAAVLAKAKAGDKLVVAGYGDGAEAMLFQVTENISQASACRGVPEFLKRQRPMSSYAKYLNYRDIIGESSYDAFTSTALLWREEKQNLKLYGVKCTKCGKISFPRRRICHSCSAKDQMADFKLGRRGKVYTYTNDYLYLNPDPPESLAAVDLEGGGRLFCQVTDVNPEDMCIGLEVELSFRKLHDGQNLPNYFWKARPAIGR